MSFQNAHREFPVYLPDETGPRYFRDRRDWALLAACDPYWNTRPIVIAAKPALIEHQFCIALQDAGRGSQDAVVIRGTATHGKPDVIHITCDGQQHELLFALASPPDDLGMKQWQKSTKSAECASCPKYDITATFVGVLQRDDHDPSRLLYLVNTADNVQRKRIHYGAR